MPDQAPNLFATLLQKADTIGSDLPEKPTVSMMPAVGVGSLFKKTAASPLGKTLLERANILPNTFDPLGWTDAIGNAATSSMATMFGKPEVPTAPRPDQFFDAEENPGGVRAEMYGKNFRGELEDAALHKETTRLTPEEALQFQAWLKANNIQDSDHPQSFYDYRGYWKDIASKGGDSTKMYEDGLHFTDAYKQHGHPTFSVESKYSSGPGDGGTWDGEKFIPPRNKP